MTLLEGKGDLLPPLKKTAKIKNCYFLIDRPPCGAYNK